MDKFQFTIMAEILIDAEQRLTKEQCDTYAAYFNKHVVAHSDMIYGIKTNILQKKLFHKIAQSHLHRSETTKEFMDKMLQKVW